MVILPMSVILADLVFLTSLVEIPINALSKFQLPVERVSTAGVEVLLPDSKFQEKYRQ
jgi:hypothetical protein